MGDLNEEQRAKILGLNAARMFNLEVRRRVPMPAARAN